MARAGLGVTEADGKIFLLGGHDPDTPVKLCESFLPDGAESPGEWTRMAPMLARRAYLSVSTLDRKIYASGGSADGRALNSIEVFDLEKVEWSHWFHIPPMQTKRTMHASEVGDGLLFVIGGFDGMRDLRTVEAYNPETNAWSWCSRMEEGRSYLAVCRMAGIIYAIGGQDRRQDRDWPRAHHTVEAFDLYSMRWFSAPPLSIGRLGLSASVLIVDGEEYIYACGGSDGKDVLRTVERYNVKEGAWTEAPPMHVCRLSHAAAVVENRLYIIGGFDGKEMRKTFECFDPELGRWGPLFDIAMLPEKVADAAVIADS